MKNFQANFLFVCIGPLYI